MLAGGDRCRLYRAANSFRRDSARGGSIVSLHPGGFCSAVAHRCGAVAEMAGVGLFRRHGMDAASFRCATGSIAGFAEHPDGRGAGHFLPTSDAGAFSDSQLRQRTRLSLRAQGSHASFAAALSRDGAGHSYLRLRRHRHGDGEGLGRACGSRVDRQERPSHSSQARFLAHPFGHVSRPCRRPLRRAPCLSVRRLPALSFGLPDRRISLPRGGRCPTLLVVPLGGKSWKRAGSSPARLRRQGLWLRHLPERLSVEPRRDPRGRPALRAARSRSLVGSGNGSTDRRAVQVFVLRHGGRARPIPWVSPKCLVVPGRPAGRQCTGHCCATVSGFFAHRRRRRSVGA